jgi:hypothetical protein
MGPGGVPAAHSEPGRPGGPERRTPVAPERGGTPAGGSGPGNGDTLSRGPVSELVQLARGNPFVAIVVFGVAGGLVLSAFLVGLRERRRRGSEQQTAESGGVALPRGELAIALAGAGFAVAVTWTLLTQLL